MKKGTVLSVDDDQNLQTVLEHYLLEDGYEVATAPNLAEAVERVESKKFDVILLDLVLPDGEGMTLIPKLRNKSAAAIIVVSGKSNTTEKIVCLEMGADDYMTKPFEMRELSARIKAVLRRSADTAPAPPQAAAEAAPEVIDFMGWRLDRKQLQLFDAGGDSAGLTTGEFKLLEALVLSPSRVLSREYLFDLTRGGEYDAYDRAIDIQIARIRKKLKDSDGSIIKTVRGAGYMFALRDKGK